jgi:ribonucleoside-diphosphate reductase alpha chain
LNVLKFFDIDRGMSFKVGDLRHVVDVMLTAMDIVNGFSELPTERIQQNTRDLRQCGLGFTNLGAALMACGLPYDSVEARDVAASLTALLTGRAYHHSSVLAQKIAPFKHFDSNRDTMLNIINMHIEHLSYDESKPIWSAACADWYDACDQGHQYGYRNSQTTAMMPTGTVSFLLGCDTTGIEPAFSLVTVKKLAAAGEMTIVNQSAQMGARALGGYCDDNIKSMSEGDFSCISAEDLPTFATAIGDNSIEPMGHLRMVAAIQPFVSQAISKTTNLPNTATVDDIFDVYMEAWKQGVKVLSIYRDGSKATQVLSAKKDDKTLLIDVADEKPVLDPQPARRRLLRTRDARRHKIHVRSTVGEHEGYVSVSFHEDGSIGEVFLEGFGRMGGFTQNILSAWATDISIALQYGVPLDVLMRKHIGHCDETGGVVVPEPGQALVITSCGSIVDYIARWIVSECGDVDLQEEFGVMTDAVKARKIDQFVVEQAVTTQSSPVTIVTSNGNGHARSVELSPNPCPSCTAPLKRTGSCWTCSAACGYHSGCG